MDIRTAGQVIRDTVSMEDILSLYGYPPPKRGFMSCPFHVGDRTASLKVYKNGHGWHCFGCDRGGSVIDFVMEHDGCSYSIAVKAIDEAMDLGLTLPGNPYREEREKRLQGALDGLEKAWLSALDSLDRQIDCWLERDLQKVWQIEDLWPEDQTTEKWTEHGQLMDEMEWLELKKVEIEQARKEVREWRTTNQRRMAEAR